MCCKIGKLWKNIPFSGISARSNKILNFIIYFQFSVFVKEFFSVSDYEKSLLVLLDTITNGTSVKINETGRILFSYTQN